MDAAHQDRALCPYCGRPTVAAQELPPDQLGSLLQWMADRPAPMLKTAGELRLCESCARVYERQWWSYLASRPAAHKAPCPVCGSYAALAPFVGRGYQSAARLRFPRLAHRSLCLFCSVGEADDPAVRCQHCAVEPKLYLCTQCDGVAKWSDTAGQPYRVFELAS